MVVSEDVCAGVARSERLVDGRRLSDRLLVYDERRPFGPRRGNGSAVTAAYIGEPLNTAPVSGTLWFHEKTPAQVTTLLGTTNRLVSIQVAQASPLLLTGTMVPNTGNYQKTWWWFSALTPEQLQLYTQTLRARPVSMDAYASNGTTVFAVVMISNAGTEYQGWRWYNGGSLTDLTTMVQQFNGRLIDLRRTGTGSSTQYTALMVSNTGPDATQSWWYPGLTVAQISAICRRTTRFWSAFHRRTRPGRRTTWS